MMDFSVWKIHERILSKQRWLSDNEERNVKKVNGQTLDKQKIYRSRQYFVLSAKLIFLCRLLERHKDLGSPFCFASIATDSRIHVLFTHSWKRIGLFHSLFIFVSWFVWGIRSGVCTVLKDSSYILLGNYVWWCLIPYIVQVIWAGVGSTTLYASYQMYCLSAPLSTLLSELSTEIWFTSVLTTK